MKWKEYITMLLFDLRSNKRILSSLTGIKNNIDRHMRIRKEVLT